MSQPASPIELLDSQLGRLSQNAQRFALAPALLKAEWLGTIRRRVGELASAMVGVACEAKGVDPDSALAGEEWLSGPGILLRHLRLYEESLRRLVATGTTIPEGRLRVRSDGRTTVGVFPADAYDRLLFPGFSAETWLRRGLSPEQAAAEAGAFYRKEPKGALSVVLGAGNIAAIPAVDALHKLFVEGRVCVLKLNPVNDYLGPFFERAFAELIEEGFFAVAYGGGEVGAYLAEHALVHDVHITGSDTTHDLIVWGPAGEERELRLRERRPKLQKAITSELGNISPAVIAPALYSERELAYMARNIVASFVYNAAFNCNATKLLVLPQGWPQRPLFLEQIGRFLTQAEPRLAYYPGAEHAWQRFVSAAPQVQLFGERRAERLPWALITGVDASDFGNQSFTVEPFCAVLSQTSLGSMDAKHFFAELVPFLNHKVWGTLNAMLLVPPRLERDPEVRLAMEQAISTLEYGVVAINHWPALAFGLGCVPWGGYPNSTLENVQSGIGFVHNTFMLEGVEKSILRGPFQAFPLPMWFTGHRSQHHLGRAYVDFETRPAWHKLLGLAWHALRP